MNHKETFEDEGFVYELTVQPTGNTAADDDLHSYCQEEGFYCRWAITGKQNNLTRRLAVTDDDCKVIVYHTMKAAIKGAREFLCI